MLRKIFIMLFAVVLFQTTHAQGICRISGKIDDATMGTGEIKKVYLTRIDEYNRHINIDSAKVKKGKYVFSYKLASEEPVMLYLITGFDDGNIEVFLEPGNVEVNTSSATEPANSAVSGTVTNNLYTEFKQISELYAQLQSDTIRKVSESNGIKWMESKEGREFRTRMQALMQIKCDARRFEFLLDNRTSPLAPLMMQRYFAPQLSETYAAQLMKTIPESMQHPYRRALYNKILSEQLRVGNDLPDISIPLRDGTITHLSDYRGKYVLLDFWASWCGPCMRDMPQLKQLYDETREYKDKFLIVSFSLDNKESAWKETVATLDIDREGWIHGSDLMGKESPVISYLNIESIPHMILVDPEGKAISFALKGEELKRRVKQILGGDLYYLNEKK